MYENIGRKIKGLAIVVFAIMAILSVVAGVFMLFRDNGGFLIGILIAGIGILLSWVGTFFLYGFGQLIENTDILVYQTKNMSKNIEKISNNNVQKDVSNEKVAESIKSSNQSAPNTSATVKSCPLCGEKVTSKTCKFCGTTNNLF